MAQGVAPNDERDPRTRQQVTDLKRELARLVEIRAACLGALTARRPAGRRWLEREVAMTGARIGWIQNALQRYWATRTCRECGCVQHAGVCSAVFRTPGPVRDTGDPAHVRALLMPDVVAWDA